MSAPICPYCGSESRLTTGKEVYPRLRHLHKNSIYVCTPCDALVGCHQGTTKPLGRLANAQLRRAKMAAHSVFDLKWRTGGMKRKNAYGWLAEHLGIEVKNCHIGMFDIEMCQRVLEVCR